MRLASIGSPSPAHLTKHVFELFRTVRPGSPELTVTMPIGELVRALNAYRPEAIATYPTILHLLAEEQLEGRLHIEPRALATSSEVLTEEIRQRARAAWGVTPRNAYASTEGGMMASECPAGCGLHVWEDTVILEVVDDRDRPVSPGSPGSKVLLTNLWNRTQPLIRYELADAVTLAEGANPTGRPFARIADVGGRSADILRLPSRDGGEVALHPIHLRTPFTRISEVQQYQFSLAPGALRVRLVLVPDAPRDVPERVQAELAGALERAGAAPIAIEARPVDAIPRVGAGAKLTLLDAGAPPAEPLLARGSSPRSGDRRAARLRSP
jgi:phenylacetate-coenzyme A ligase PaaK-like adenylate-forming protein